MPTKASRDALGRRSRMRPQSTGKRITPQPRDLLWFEKLAEHGPLPSTFLLEFCKGTHCSEKRGKERLTDLFNESDTPDGGAYLTRPAQQFSTMDARYQPIVYELSPASVSALRKIGCAIEPRRSGPYRHSLMVSCITASFELACWARDDVNYIPQSRILARANASLRWPTEVHDPEDDMTYQKDLIPDAVFGLEYLTPEGSRYRFFALEADRATEPLRSSTNHRKSFKRHLLQYEDYIECGSYREHLTLSAPMLVLNVTTSERRVERMLEVTREFYPSGNSYQLFQAHHAFELVKGPRAPIPGLLNSRWVSSVGDVPLVDPME
ncbi:MAG: replication-relaxation family protein [Erythrobacter sp.]|uniref:replication-relaxation family protein n=1 Tax=Erythrobacter sp. TaxID=1042 RepID=UPI0026245747|nr:replication-relaxation family protein [Erythrobacter sp.]MDJ0977261.1 replication-relaxation family protein [Erythrobacter sp.]